MGVDCRIGCLKPKSEVLRIECLVIKNVGRRCTRYSDDVTGFLAHSRYNGEGKWDGERIRRYTIVWEGKVE